jgi:uncharacterized membrane protein
MNNIILHKFYTFIFFHFALTSWFVTLIIVLLVRVSKARRDNFVQGRFDYYFVGFPHGILASFHNLFVTIVTCDVSPSVSK